MAASPTSPTGGANASSTSVSGDRSSPKWPHKPEDGKHFEGLYFKTAASKLLVYCGLHGYSPADTVQVLQAEYNDDLKNLSVDIARDLFEEVRLRAPAPRSSPSETVIETLQVMVDNGKEKMPRVFSDGDGSSRDRTWFEYDLPRLDPEEIAARRALVRLFNGSQG